ncbi:NUDIX domain-containing protein [Ornithinibacillus sp. L9]|uniref:NUDIX domain-containing protein n=1 Tax=Ornithinibacillus caprae TaxID=2678566 RepID=A0A6N8FI66_9BACI|nr:NUDIX domain-containing protein [Ornithinibacillus caprae]MUK89290.1 NUDIX domain-containing protein [Ornithinibacillus caprae]
MKLRQMAVAFLLNEEQEVLFLQKKPKDTFLGGLLVPIGGHIEGNEISQPKGACLREIEEETGLKRDYINDLTLRYVVLRAKENKEIRIQFVFFGTVSKNFTLIESDEGSLKWVKFQEIANQNVSATTIEIVKHYKDFGESMENVYVGSMKSLKGKPTITWGLLEDWEMPILNGGNS